MLEGWGKAIEAREQFSPLAACWSSELGGLNTFVHTWVYKDLNARARVREASRKPGGSWPPQTGVRPIRQENKLLMPAAFSPVRQSCMVRIPLGCSASQTIPAPQSPEHHAPAFSFPQPILLRVTCAVHADRNPFIMRLTQRELAEVLRRARPQSQLTTDGASSLGGTIRFSSDLALDATPRLQSHRIHENYS